MRTIKPTVIIRRRENQEELVEGTLILKPAVQQFDEKEAEVVHSFPEANVQPGDKIWILNCDGVNMQDADDRYLEHIDFKNILGVLEGNSLRPLRHRVLCELVDEEEVTAGGIILPENYRKKSKHYKVLAVGPGRELSDGSLSTMEVKPGDLVVTEPFTGVGFKNKQMIFNSEDIVAVLEEVVNG